MRNRLFQLTLTTPRWIPGTHMPAGPAEDITEVFGKYFGSVDAWYSIRHASE